MDIFIRPCESTDLPGALLLSQQMKWPHLIEDWNLAFNTGKGLVATVNEKIVGTAFYWAWGNNVATIGLVIVDNEVQGQGIGRRLMGDVLNSLKGYSVKLHATEMGRPLYEKLGFKKSGFIIQYHRIGQFLQDAKRYNMPEGCRIRTCFRNDFSDILNLDFNSCGMKRDGLLLEAINHFDVRVLISPDNVVIGYGAIRKSGLGYSIGPVVCKNDNHAKLLIIQMINSYKNDFIRIDTYGGEDFKKWLVATGFEVINTPVTMCLNENKDFSPRDFKNYSLISQAMF